MRVLITGGAGFIGSHLADTLLDRGDQVLAIDNYATGRRDNLSPHPGLTVVEGTIADPEVVAECFAAARPEVVVHTAASYKNPDDWVEDSRTNVLGTAHIARGAREARVRRLIYFQTAMCYGLQPLEQPITLDHPIRAEGSSYAITKTAAEQLVFLSGVDAVSFRMANAYGPRHLTGPLPLFFQRLSAGQACIATNTRRDFVFIDDLVELVMKAIDGVGEAGCYHLSSGNDYSMEELHDQMVRAMGIGPVKAEVRERTPGDVFSILLDPMRTYETFNWCPTTPLGVGIERTIAYYREHGIRETYTHLKLGNSS